eukprot:g3215.t1
MSEIDTALGFYISAAVTGAGTGKAMAVPGAAKAVKGAGKLAGVAGAEKKRKGRAAGKGAAVVDAAAEAAERAQYVDYFGGPLAKGAAARGAGEQGQYYITTAINYTNGPPHIGHAYEAVTTDAIARYHRAYGRDTYFLTGTDEHGQKIAESAEREGVTPQQICDKYAAGFQALNKRFAISNNHYVRTTDPKHEKYAQWIFKRCFDAGDIYLGTYTGWYNVKEEAFVADNEAELANFKDAAGNPLEKRNESTYMFRMSKYQERLLKHYADNPDFCQPEDKRNIILKRLEEPLRDLSSTRTTFSWGIPIPPECRDPADEGKPHVMYVWFDALSNYASGVTSCQGLDPAACVAGAGRPADASRFWPADAHVIGKDITWFHCVIWPCMLMSAGVPLYKSVVAHGFVMDGNGEKMSKSLGNVVDPNKVLDGGIPADSFRYYLVSQTPYGADLPCSEAAMTLLHNSLLNDTLGNLVHRAVNICHKYCGGKVPAAPAERVFDVAQLRDKTEAAFSKYKLSVACELAFEATRETNRWLTEKEPWKMKEDRAAERAAAVRTALEAIYLIAHFISPYIPEAASGIFWKINAVPSTIATLSPAFDNLQVGAEVRLGATLYKKIESAEAKKKLEEKAKAREMAKAAAANKAKKTAKAKASQKAQGGGAGGAEQPEITMVDIRVGVITKAWDHPEAAKLFCEDVDIGEVTGARQIASGLRDHYSLEQMQGRRVLVLANLKPRKLQGFASNGMVLCAAAADGSKMEFVEPPAGAAPGERVYCEGLSGEPLEPNKVVKRDRKTKLTPLDRVLAKLATGTGGQAQWDGKPLLTSAGPCAAATLAGVPVK